MTALTDRAIRAMPYESRLRHYTQEKNELFDQIAHMTAEEVRKAHEDLARKWKI
ncbi:MAG: hypothetical protein J6S50_04875 [Oscillospiraceae bacterium]|nr:hypothetical protein [Oscillospiraceae bacterium]